VIVHLVRELADFDSTTSYTLYSVRPIGEVPALLASLPSNVRFAQVTALKPQLRYLAWHTVRRPHLERWIGTQDVVHATSPNVVPALRSGRLVLTVHDLVWWRYPEGLTRWGRFFHRTGLAIAAREASAIGADSEATRRDVLARMGSQIDPAKVQTILLGTTMARETDPVRVATVKAAHGITGDYVLAIGTREPRKNHRRLLEAFRALPDGIRTRTQLVVIGAAGWGVDDHSTPKDDRVVWTGYVADDDMRALLSGATAFAYPSLFEGFGLPILEAMACEVPVLTSNSSSMPEVAGDAALQIDPYSVDAIAAALTRLLTDAGLRRELVCRGRTQRTRFSFRRMAEQYRELYERAAGSRPPGTRVD